MLPTKRLPLWPERAIWFPRPCRLLCPCFEGEGRRYETNRPQEWFRTAVCQTAGAGLGAARVPERG